LLDDGGDAGDTREERAFRMWMNSLNIPDLNIENLYEDCKDGLALLRVLEKILGPGSVDWKKAALKPDHKLKKIQNCNYAVDVAKNEKTFHVVAIGGVDIHDGKPKMILALVWQMVRKHVLDMLGGMQEDKLLAWANLRVTNVPKISSFKDKSLKDSKFLFEVLESIEPRAINKEFVTAGATPEEVEKNAKYVISVARRIGATTFMVWEDIKEAKANMIMTFIASLAKVAEDLKKM